MLEMFNGGFSLTDVLLPRDLNRDWGTIDILWSVSRECQTGNNVLISYDVILLFGFWTAQIQNAAYIELNAS